MATSISPELLKSLEAVTLMIQNVLDDTKEHATSLAILKAKLEDLAENVGTLSHIVREGNGKGSIVTRLALIEKSSEDIEEEINDLKESVSLSIRDLKQLIENAPKQTAEEEKRQDRDKSIAKWQFWGALLAAFTALGFQLFSMLHK